MSPTDNWFITVSTLFAGLQSTVVLLEPFVASCVMVASLAYVVYRFSVSRIEKKIKIIELSILEEKAKEK